MIAADQHERAPGKSKPRQQPRIYCDGKLTKVVKRDGEWHCLRCGRPVKLLSWSS